MPFMNRIPKFLQNLVLRSKDAASLGQATLEGKAKKFILKPAKKNSFAIAVMFRTYVFFR